MSTQYTREDLERRAKLATESGGIDPEAALRLVRERVRSGEALSYHDLSAIEPFLLWGFLPLLMDATVLGSPVGKGRPRVVKRGRHVSTYTPKKTADWEHNAAWTFRAAYAPRPVHEGLVAVCVAAVKERPNRLMRKKDPDGRMYRSTLPDGDNVLKAVADALQKGGVIRDDKQVVEWHVRSAYTTKTEGPSVAVRVYKIRESE